MLVATFGLAASASANITNHFDDLASTDVTVVPAAADDDPDAAGLLNNVDPARVERINGVVAAATYTEPTSIAANVSGLLVVDPQAGAQTYDVAAASENFGELLEADMRGAWFNRVHMRRADPVVVLGRVAAEQLGVNSVDGTTVVFVNDQPMVVVGIVDEVTARPEVLTAVIVPTTWALAHIEGFNVGFVAVRTDVGAAQVVADQIPVALMPKAPETITATAPPTPTITRDKVSGDTQALLIGLAAISLIVGGVGTANVTLVSVMERTAEIGLRRALGATRRHVVAQFLTESAATGFLGAVMGAALGVLVTVVVAIAAGWPPVIDPLVPLAAPLVGLAIGALAGAYPAHRAGRIEPIGVLRQGT